MKKFEDVYLYHEQNALLLLTLLNQNTARKLHS